MKPLPRECRDFLRAFDDADRTGEHVARCAACADHAAFRDRVAGMLRAAPPAPGALRSPSVLTAIHERIIEAAERAPLGRLLARAPSVPAPDAAAWPEPALDAALGAAVGDPPPMPTPLAWNAVRRSILARLAPRRLARSRAALWLGLAGLAAAALVTTLVTSGDSASDLTIVFADLDVAPGNEFAVLRYGALR